MRVTMFSMTPLFANKSMGGAQKQLKKVALHLGASGHQVTILCTYRHPDASEAFSWHENVVVQPVLRFKQPFPEPYDTPIYNIANAVEDVAHAIAKSDAFYSHDGGIIFPYLYGIKPSIVSLRSILFSETLQSGFLFQGDALILPSPHTAQAWQATVGRFFPEFASRVRVIPNGLDFATYRPQPADALIARMELDPVKYAYLLYPHRPEEAKGIRQTIALADKLIHQYGVHNLRVLVPKWIDSGLAPHVKAYYDSLAQDIQARGLGENFIFHDWISDDDMPLFYNVGALTVALGNYVETFGNTPYESLACGTPALVANVGAYRGILPDDLLIDYGDLETAAERAYRVLEARERTPAPLMQWLHDNFAQRDMVNSYAELILSTPKREPMPFVPPAPHAPTTRYTLATWCYISPTRGIFHDFKGAFYDEPTLATLANAYPDGFSEAHAPADALARWRRDGFIVPVRL